MQNLEKMADFKKSRQKLVNLNLQQSNITMGKSNEFTKGQPASQELTSRFSIFYTFTNQVLLRLRITGCLMVMLRI